MIVFPLVGEGLLLWYFKTRLFHRKNEKNVERTKVPGRKRKHSEEIKRAKKNEITKQRKRNVTITGEMYNCETNLQN